MRSYYENDSLFGINKVYKPWRCHKPSLQPWLMVPICFSCSMALFPAKAASLNYFRATEGKALAEAKAAGSFSSLR
jgi:hypothetical protein